MESKLTLDEFYRRGLELPSDMLGFYVDEMEYSKEDLQGYGGVYMFLHGSRCLYVGISADVWTRIKKHLSGYSSNNRLQDALAELDDIIIRVWFEENLANREIYETYLIATESPECNTHKLDVNTTKPVKLTKKEIEEQRLIDERVKIFDLAQKYIKGERDLAEVAEELDVTELRAKYLISPWVGYDD